MNEYLLLRIPPDHSFYVMGQNIVSCLISLMLCVSVIMFYQRPPIKESPEYKVTVYSQHVLLFLLSISWSLIGKLYPELQDDFMYSEGYLHFLGLSSGEFYSICCFLFGAFGAFLIISFCYRLRMIVSQNHLIRQDNFFYGYYVSIIFCYAILPPIFFYRAFRKDYDLTLHPLNFTKAQIDYFSKSAFTYLPILSFNCMVYTVYYGSLLVCASLMLFAIFYSIIAEIRRKQSIISAGKINHHKKVLKTLTIQAGLTLAVFFSAPVTLYASLFIHVNSHVVEVSLMLFGFSFFVHCSISLFLYDSKKSRKAIKNLFFLKQPKKKTELNKFSTSRMIL